VVLELVLLPEFVDEPVLEVVFVVEFVVVLVLELVPLLVDEPLLVEDPEVVFVEVFVEVLLVEMLDLPVPNSSGFKGEFSKETDVGSETPVPLTLLNRMLKTKSPELSSVEMKSRKKLIPLRAV